MIVTSDKSAIRSVNGQTKSGNASPNASVPPSNLEAAPQVIQLGTSCFLTSIEGSDQNGP